MIDDMWLFIGSWIVLMNLMMSEFYIRVLKNEIDWEFWWNGLSVVSNLIGKKVSVFLK